MARPGRTESASLPIWLKLSEADAAQMERVLARPEFEGWTRAEWCLEIIQTALRYYARRDLPDEAGQERTSARPAPAAPEPAAAAPEPAPPAAKPKRAAAKPRRPAAKAKPTAPRAERPAPEAQVAAPERGAPERAARPEGGPLEPLEPPECSHPAEARDYQTGTCGACGAILWD